MVGLESEEVSQVEYEEVLDFCMNTGFLDVLVDLRTGSNVDLILRQIKVKTMQILEKGDEDSDVRTSHDSLDLNKY